MRRGLWAFSPVRATLPAEATPRHGGTRAPPVAMWGQRSGGFAAQVSLPPVRRVLNIFAHTKLGSSGREHGRDRKSRKHAEIQETQGIFQAGKGPGAHLTMTGKPSFGGRSPKLGLPAIVRCGGRAVNPTKHRPAGAGT